MQHVGSLATSAGRDRFRHGTACENVRETIILMQWLTFEHEVRDLVAAFGYRADTTTPSHDYGVDVVAENERRRVVIQCKLFGKGRVGGDTIMKLIGSRQYFAASDAICITTGRFTKQASEIAERQDVKLIDGTMLVALCRERHLTIPSLTALETDDGSVLAIGPGFVSIGRDEQNDLVLPFPNISRQHATLQRNALHLTLRDCSSRNGTLVNGLPIQRVIVRYGDLVMLAGCKLRVVLVTPDGTVLA